MTSTDIHSSSAGLNLRYELIGSQGKNKITAEELARLSKTIPYEIVCGLGSRVPRIYIG